MNPRMGSEPDIEAVSAHDGRRRDARTLLFVLLERAAILLASLALSVGLIAVMSGFFASRDRPGVGAGSLSVGTAYPDQGDTILPPGASAPQYDSEPPTSGPHHSATIGRDAARLSDDQILTALSQGNVVLEYGTATAPIALQRLEHDTAGPFDPALAAVGQAVVLGRRPGIHGIVALAWSRMLRVGSPTDPLLRVFVLQWLGHRPRPG